MPIEIKTPEATIIFGDAQAKVQLQATEKDLDIDEKIDKSVKRYFEKKKEKTVSRATFWMLIIGTASGFISMLHDVYQWWPSILSIIK